MFLVFFFFKMNNFEYVCIDKMQKNMFITKIYDWILDNSNREYDL
jgi:hypothetical protein